MTFDTLITGFLMPTSLFKTVKSGQSFHRGAAYQPIGSSMPPGFTFYRALLNPILIWVWEMDSKIMKPRPARQRLAA